jgi:hypothetical protein
MTPNRNALAAAAALTVAGMTGCADEPTKALPDAAAPIHIGASAAERNAVGAGLSDASERVLPSLLSLERLVNEAELGAQLDAIAAALERDDARALERGVVRAERALERLTARDDAGAGASELEAIRIAVAEARRLLSGANASTEDETTTPNRSRP